MLGRTSLRSLNTAGLAIPIAVLAVAVVLIAVAYLVLSGDDGAAGLRTEVIEFAPPAVATTTLEGACFSPSLAVAREGAWRCSVGNSIYDPCFGAAEAAAVICVQDPTRVNEAVEIGLLSPLSEVEPFPVKPDLRPWTVETSDGVICSYMTGATGPVNGERLNYGCADGTSLIGDPQPGDTWTARSVTLGGSIPPPGTEVAETEVTLRRVWQ